MRYLIWIAAGSVILALNLFIAKIIYSYVFYSISIAQIEWDDYKMDGNIITEKLWLYYSKNGHYPESLNDITAPLKKTNISDWKYYPPEKSYQDMYFRITYQYQGGVPVLLGDSVGLHMIKREVSNYR
jgi:hypothetical protein